MFELFITPINYAKLIKMQANQPAPFEKAIDIKRMPNGQSKMKKLGCKKGFKK